MAWDSNRGNLIFWGGGHANYPGNEVYRWVGSSLRWERASLPSEVVRNTESFFTTLYEAVDGPFAAPTSAHTYDNSEFLPINDRFVTFGGASFNTGHYFELGNGRRTGPYFWEPARASADAVGGTLGSQVKPQVYPLVAAGSMWQNRDNLVPTFDGDLRPGYGGTNWIDGTTAYAEEGGKDVLYIGVASQLFRYTVNALSNPQADTYELMGRYVLYPFSGQGAGALDLDRKIYLRTSGSVFTYWTLNNPGASNQNVIFTPTVVSGTFPFGSLNMHGMDFDPIRRSFVLWSGQRDCACVATHCACKPVFGRMELDAFVAGDRLRPLTSPMWASPSVWFHIRSRTGSNPWQVEVRRCRRLGRFPRCYAPWPNR